MERKYAIVYNKHKEKNFGFCFFSSIVKHRKKKEAMIYTRQITRHTKKKIR